MFSFGSSHTKHFPMCAKGTTHMLSHTNDQQMGSTCF
uniref:Uncharacterized protein n=1 Tax=Anguilla anguilla TaxID=7936 RepID=A0A0E9WBN7_ANGAN